LDPFITKDKWRRDEDDLIMRLHQKLGNKWCEIAKQMPGRTDNAIKNRYNSKLKKFDSRPDEECSSPNSDSRTTSDRKREKKALVKTIVLNGELVKSENSYPES
jgi:hypothetical protein